MEHSFNTDIAGIYGVPEAVFIHNLYFWILHNECNGRHFYEGKNWTYNSLSALEKLFPYFTRKQIRTVVDHCVAKGAVIKGNFNKEGYDKTNWFALSEDVLRVYRGYAPEGTTHAPEGTERYAPEGTTYAPEGTTYAPEGTTIPDSKPDSKPDIDTRGRARAKPTVEEIRAYCRERRNRVDPQQFFDYYESNGWMAGKNPVRDWRAKVRYWENNGVSAPARQNPSAQTGGNSSIDMGKINAILHQPIGCDGS